MPDGIAIRHCIPIDPEDEVEKIHSGKHKGRLSDKLCCTVHHTASVAQGSVMYKNQFMQAIIE